MESETTKSYHRTTIYLTGEQRRWLSQVSARARLDGLGLSASDVIRLALARLQNQLSEDELRHEVIAHVQAEAKNYPGRAKRGLPMT